MLPLGPSSWQAHVHNKFEEFSQGSDGDLRRAVLGSDPAVDRPQSGTAIAS
jgi:hypothetical protein